MLEQVKDYYGKTLRQSSDLQTDACCTTAAPPPHIQSILTQINDEVMSRYYGCGLIAPEALSGLKILDLGCGAGRDAYVLSALVGESGQIVGVDMTAEQLAIAERHIDYHRRQFGYSKPNIEFHHGQIEQLDALPFADNSFDLIVSNCVINLSLDKAAVLKQAHRLLKPGGELYFSDVYSDRRVPDTLANDPVLYGECLGGALYWNDFLPLAKRCGFLDPRLVEDRPLEIQNAEIKTRLGNINFYSATYRLFKLENLEYACEDYGQAVVYRGSIDQHSDFFQLDKHHRIERGKIFPVCGNTWQMLHDTRFRPHFDFIGDGKTHYGIFQGCGSELPFEQHTQQESSCC